MELPRKLPDWEPSVSNGRPNGAQAPVGEPDTLPPTYCRKCQAEVKPEGKGRCPRCQTFLRLNFVARKHPVNVLRRDALLADLLAQFPPANVVQRAARGQLAAALERLETTKPGTTEWQRLSTVVKELSDDLCPPTTPIEAPTDNPLGDLSTDELLAQTEALLEILRAQRGDDRRETAAPPAPLSTPEPEARGGSTEADDLDPTRPTPFGSGGPALEATAPAETCPYCYKPCAECADLKVTRQDFWRACHYLDPLEIERRRQEETGVMFKMLGKQSPYL